MKIVLATGNSGKVAELQRRLGETIEVIPQSEFDVVAPEETGLTFVENALIKARAAAEQTGLPAIADDSGLCVDALHGQPGIYSARYSGKGATDQSNNHKLLEALSDIPDSKRTAHFQCALVLMRHATDPTPIICQGKWNGTILKEIQGEGGFGYDPLFYAHDCQTSAAQLSPDRKNQISHRGRAMTQLLECLNSDAMFNLALNA